MTTLRLRLRVYGYASTATRLRLRMPVIHTPDGWQDTYALDPQLDYVLDAFLIFASIADKSVGDSPP